MVIEVSSTKTFKHLSVTFTGDVIFLQLLHLCSKKEDIVEIVSILIKWKYLVGMVVCLNYIVYN